MRTFRAIILAIALLLAAASIATAAVIDLPRLPGPCPAGTVPNADGCVVCVYVGPTHQCAGRAVASPSTSCPFVASIVTAWDATSCYNHHVCKLRVVSPVTRKRYSVTCVNHWPTSCMASGTSAWVQFYRDPPGNQAADMRAAAAKTDFLPG
jgi:hypothetical protein